jgi:hypothetical protein
LATDRDLAEKGMRELFREGVRWTVREASAAQTPGAKSYRCLIFDSEGVVRRLWAFPEAWNDLADDQILALLDAPPTPSSGITAVRNSGSHPAIAAAAAAHAHAQSLVAEFTLLRDANRLLGDERRALLDSCRLGRDEMRSAVQRYVQTLRRGGVPPERAVALLKSAIEDGLGGPLSREAPGCEEIMGDGIRWGIEAYYAA